MVSFKSLRIDPRVIIWVLTHFFPKKNFRLNSRSILCVWNVIFLLILIFEPKCNDFSPKNPNLYELIKIKQSRNTVRRQIIVTHELIYLIWKPFWAHSIIKYLHELDIYSKSIFHRIWKFCGEHGKHFSKDSFKNHYI